MEYYIDHFEGHPEPKKFTKRQYVLTTIKVYDKDGNEIRNFTRDYGKRTTQEWMVDLLMWALMSGYHVELNRRYNDY